MKLIKRYKMTNQNNAPKDLDLSACNVSMDGGNTSQQLSELVKTANDTNSKIADILNIASNSKQDVDNLTTKIDNIYSKENNYQPNGVLPLDNTGQFLFQPAKNEDGVTYITAGYLQKDGYIQVNTKSREIHYQYSVNSNGNDGNNKSYIDTIWADDFNAYYAFGSVSFHPLNDGGGDLGRAGNSWNNLFIKTAPNVTSDKNVKTITSILDEKADNSDRKLLDALYNVNVVNYKLNDAIKEKGEDKARVHTGFIAQDMEQAIRDAGLDPSDYAMWTQDASPEFKRVDTGEKDENGNPILKSVQEVPKDDKGDVIYSQKLRYTEVICMLLAAHKQKINDLETRLMKLESK